MYTKEAIDGGFLSHRGTPSHHPFRTMGFSLTKTNHFWGYPHSWKPPDLRSFEYMRHQSFFGVISDTGGNRELKCLAAFPFDLWQFLIDPTRLGGFLKPGIPKA